MELINTPIFDIFDFILSDRDCQDTSVVSYGACQYSRLFFPTVSSVAPFVLFPLTFTKLPLSVSDETTDNDVMMFLDEILDKSLVMGDTSFFGRYRYHEFWSIPIPKSIPILNFFHLLK